MNKLTKALSVAALTTMPCMGAVAEIQPLWKKVGDWSIHIDKTVNYGCFMYGAYEFGDVLRIGFDRTRGNAYAIIGNAQWRSLVVGQKYEIQFQFDDNQRWRGVAYGIKLQDGKQVLLRLSLSNVDFMKELKEAYGLRIFYNGQNISSLKLPNSAAAVDEMVHCQDEVERSRTTAKSDPFNAGRVDPYNKTDPFMQTR